MITATVVADSLGIIPDSRITTLELIFPRYILPQFNTHRVFSRNAASSRAIPVSKTIKQVSNDPVIPIWNLNQKGMSGNMDVPPELLPELDRIWLEARDSAIKSAQELIALGVHKQVANRLLEPFMLVKVIVTSDQWDNFFKLRIHDGAQPEIMELAIKMREAINASDPEELEVGEWHLPYIREEELHLSLEDRIKISVARCARVSYKTHDDDQYSTFIKDVALYNQLFESEHLSPFEHQASPLTPVEWTRFQNNSGNFSTFKQYRKILGH
jgi:thymidylate synthase ThyX